MPPSRNLNSSDPMTDRIARLRARVAQLAPEDRAAFRIKVEQAGIPWDRVAPEAAVAPRPARVPLSPAQMQFWLTEQLHPESAAFVIAFAWDIEGPLDADALRRALDVVADRHEPLRTRFPSEAGTPWQDVTVAEVPLDTMPYPEDRAASERDFTARGFNLAEGPAWRVRLLTDDAARHTLLVAFHHIIADGWSRGVFLRDVAAAYRAICVGHAPDQAALTHGFSDLVLDQARWLDSPEAATSGAFWRDELAGLVPQRLSAHDASGDRRAGTLTHRLGPELTHRADLLARSLGVSQFVLLLSVFQLYLHRLSGSTDIAVGTPFAGRERTEAEPLIGLFVNTLVLRNRIQPGHSFADWVRTVNEGFARAFTHRDYPFAKVVEGSGAARQADATPLFQSLFQVQSGYGAQNSAALDLGDARMTVTQRVLPLPEAKFDLSWHMIESGGDLSVIVEYRSAVFDAARIRAMVTEFETLLTSAATAPDAHVDALAFVPEAAVERGAVGAIPNVVAELVARSSDHSPAVICVPSGGRISHAALWHASEHLARCLRARPELAQGGSIAVSLPRQPGLIVAILAALRAGVPFVPLDPTLPAARRDAILSDAGVALLLSNVPCEAPCPVLDPQTLIATAREAALPAPDPDSLAYLIFTSGSTGRPKGVPITHRALSNLIASMARTPGMGAGDRLLAVTTIGFDIALLELLLPLYVGGTLVLADDAVTTDPAQLAEALRSEQITHMQGTPATWRLLVDHGWIGQAGLTALCGGEALKPDLARALLPKVGALWNMYGPTETTIWSAVLRITPDHLDRAALPIGGAVANTTLRVLDGYGAVLPDGVAGELATGDRVTRQPGGGFRFLGRIDHQIKLNGFRIEPGEVEAALTDLPGVDEAVVMVRDGLLVAWLRGRDLAADGLRQALAERLPAYMVPTRFVMLDAFPLNSNGKINRAGLPSPEAAAGSRRGPVTDIERALHDIWANVLGRDTIGIDENFFDAGGASVSAMQIASRAREAGLMLSPAQMFEHQTIAAQATIATRVTTPKHLPASPYQAALLRQGGAWRVMLDAGGRGDDDVSAMKDAVLAAHPVLGFERTPEGWHSGTEAHHWSLERAGDRLVLNVDAALLDAGSVARLATELRAGPDKDGAAPRADATYADWLTTTGPEAAPPQPLPGEGVGGVATPVERVLDGTGLRALRADAERLDTPVLHLTTAAFLRSLAQWRRAEASALVISDAPQSCLGNFTRALPLRLSFGDADTKRSLSRIAEQGSTLDPRGSDPETLPPGLAVMVWRDLPDITGVWDAVPDPILPPDPALCLLATARPDRLAFEWRFDPQRVPQATVTRLAARLLAELATAPPTPVNDKLTQLKTRRRTGRGPAR